MELGLLYYNARFYAPGLGRFLSADTIVPNPANPQSYNRYSYVLNSPLNLIDPTGHRECGASDGCNNPLPSPSAQKINQHLAEQEFLETLRKPADHQFGVFGGQRTVNCTGNCNESIHPGRDTDLTNDSNRGNSIFATADGRVVSVGYMASTWDEDNQRWRSAFGHYVVIGHEVGDETLYSVYAHLEPDSINVSVGQIVEQGDIIAGMGNSAAQRTVHLHYELRRSIALDFSQDLPFSLPDNPGGNNFFPANQEILNKYFLDIGSLEWDS